MCVFNWMFLIDGRVAYSCLFSYALNLTKQQSPCHLGGKDYGTHPKLVPGAQIWPHLLVMQGKKIVSYSF
jgi:hypothetical protein